MAQMPVVCTTCTVPVKAQFEPPSALRGTVTLSSRLEVSDQCFVADTIELLEGGQIVFAPGKERDGYFDNYNVVCRKLYIQGGNPPKDLNPCRPDDPGKTYDGNNVITWKGRLQTAADGAGQNSPAAEGESFDPNQWQDKGQGNDGKGGGAGANGAKGNNGGEGRPALGFDGREKRPILNVVVLEVEFASPTSHLTIDWNGQTGGDGGDGQAGGRGGDGMSGRDGSTDNSVWGDSCERGPGNGGNSGDGGNGGQGGNGGNGGNAGDIFIISTAANVGTGGVFKAGQFSYINGGGGGGDPGKGARGGRPGARFGNKGKKTSECDEAHNGQTGNSGNPDPLSSGGTVNGNPGNTGIRGNLTFEVIEPPDSKTCADLIPIVITVSSIAPNSGARGATVPVVITGTGFNPAAPLHQVQIDGFGVSATVLNVTATTLNCTFTITAAAPLNARTVKVKVGLSASIDVLNGFTVV